MRGWQNDAVVAIRCDVVACALLQESVARGLHITKRLKTSAQIDYACGKCRNSLGLRGERNVLSKVIKTAPVKRTVSSSSDRGTAG